VSRDTTRLGADDVTARARLRSDEGASAVEYALIVFAVAAVVTLAVVALGGITRGMFSDSCKTIQGQTHTTANCD
jgi:pilus assembly protein Flp/PilA